MKLPISKFLEKETVNFILSARFCDKHIKQLIKKEYKNQVRVKVKEILSICSKCGKGGICYYINE